MLLGSGQVVGIPRRGNDPVDLGLLLIEQLRQLIVGLDHQGMLLAIFLGEIADILSCLEQSLTHPLEHGAIGEGRDILQLGDILAGSLDLAEDALEVLPLGLNPGELGTELAQPLRVDGQLVFDGHQIVGAHVFLHGLFRGLELVALLLGLGGHPLQGVTARGELHVEQLVHIGFGDGIGNQLGDGRRTVAVGDIDDLGVLQRSDDQPPLDHGGNDILFSHRLAGCQSPPGPLARRFLAELFDARQQRSQRLAYGCGDTAEKRRLGFLFLEKIATIGAGQLEAVHHPPGDLGASHNSRLGLEEVRVVGVIRGAFQPRSAAVALDEHLHRRGVDGGSRVGEDDGGQENQAKQGEQDGLALAENEQIVTEVDIPLFLLLVESFLRWIGLHVPWTLNGKRGAESGPAATARKSFPARR